MNGRPTLGSAHRHVCRSGRPLLGAVQL